MKSREPADLLVPDAATLPVVRGEARLDAQFLRVNIDPTERYVASFPDTSRFRLSPDKPLLANLYITSDWVKTAFNAGCVEAAIMADLAAARAISVATPISRTRGPTGTTWR